MVWERIVNSTRGRLQPAGVAVGIRPKTRGTVETSGQPVGGTRVVASDPFAQRVRP